MHALRHSFASLLATDLELGPTTLAAIIGHADAGFTLCVCARDARDTATVVSDVLERAERAGSVHELDQADATTSRTSTPSSVTSSGASAAIALIRSPAARAFSSESNMIIESPFNPPPPVDHVQ